MVRSIKLHMLNTDNTIKYICAFTGDRFSYDDDSPIDLQNLILSDPLNAVFTEIFSESELKQIRDNQTPVVFSQWEIFPDDKISTIKFKICDTLKFQVSPEELYLFGMTGKKLNPVSVYQQLTHGDRLELTRDRMIQFLSNINSLSLDGLPIKEVYNYNDILGLDLNRQEVVIKEPIGQKFSMAEGRYLYTVNPFDLLVFDKFLEDNADTALTTLSNNLLMESFPIIDGVLYGALASDAFAYASANGQSSETFSKVYYPFLFQRQITSEESLDGAREMLSRTSIDTFRGGLETSYSSVSLFYNMKAGRKTELPFLSKGIRAINLVMNPPFVFNFPLESVFKLIHATQSPKTGERFLIFRRERYSNLSRKWLDKNESRSTAYFLPRMRTFQ